MANSAAECYGHVCGPPERDEMDEISGRNNENIYKIEEFTKCSHHIFRDLGFEDFLKEKEYLSVNWDRGIIKGSREQISKSVKQFEESFCTANVLIQGHPSIQELFFNENGSKNENILAYIVHILSIKKIVNFYFGYKDSVKSDELEGVIFCRPKEKVAIARSVIEQGFRSFPLIDCSKDGKEVIKEWKNKRKLVQTTDRDQVPYLTGTEDVMMQIDKEFNKKIIKTCPVPRHYAAFLSNQESPLLSLSQKLHVNIQVNANKSELELTGCYRDIKQAMSEIKAKMIVETVYLPTNPTARQLSEFDEIAEKHKCGWLVKSNQNAKKILGNCDYVATWYDPTRDGTFTIIEGDTYDLNVDCLIVLSTNRLFPVQISPNDALSKESRDQADKTFEVGKVFFKNSDDTKYKNAVYIVVGLANATKSKENEKFYGLSTKFKELFKVAHENQCNTVCLPAYITKGILSTEMIVDAYLDAVIECQKDGKPLKFYLFCETSKKVLTDPLVKQIHKKYKKELGFSRKLYQHPELDLKGFKTKSTPHILVEERPIESVRADVIVNTTSSNLELEKGIVSKRLLELAGNGMLAECKKHYPNGIGYTTIASTSPGGLTLKNKQVRCVFHGALQGFKRETYIQNVKTFIRRCLAQADKKAYQSIAFPALGTGSRGYPGREVAKAMFDAVEDYRREAVNGNIEKVVFSLYSKDKDICMVFKREEMKRGALKAVKKIKYGLKPYNEKKTNVRKLMGTITGSHHPVEICVAVGSDINPLNSNVVEIKMQQESESSVRWKYSDEKPETNNDQLLVPINSGESKPSKLPFRSSSPTTDYKNSLRIAVRDAVTNCLENKIAEMAFDIDSGPFNVSDDVKVATIASEIKNCLSNRKQKEGIVLHTVYVRLVDEHQFESVEGRLKTSWISSKMLSIGMGSNPEWQIIESSTDNCPIKVEIVGETREILKKVKEEMQIASLGDTDPLYKTSGDGSNVDGGSTGGARPKTSTRTSQPQGENSQPVNDELSGRNMVNDNSAYWLDSSIEEIDDYEVCNEMTAIINPGFITFKEHFKDLDRWLRIVKSTYQVTILDSEDLQTRSCKQVRGRCQQVFDFKTYLDEIFPLDPILIKRKQMDGVRTLKGIDTENNKKSLEINERYYSSEERFCLQGNELESFLVMRKLSMDHIKSMKYEADKSGIVVHYTGGNNGVERIKQKHKDLMKNMTRQEIQLIEVNENVLADTAVNQEEDNDVLCKFIPPKDLIIIVGLDESAARNSKRRILKYLGRPTTDTHTLPRERENSDQAIKLYSPQQSRNVRENISECLTVRIYASPMNEQPADCLVVPYNRKQFALTGGLLIAAGNIVTEELKQSMDTFGSLRASECRVTGSGKLKNCKSIIHMSLNENKNDVIPDLLKQAVINSLKKANEQSYRKVAILLTGMNESFLFNHAEQYFDAIHLFVREQGQITIQEVCLLHPSDECTHTAIETFKKMSFKSDVKVYGEDFVFSKANNLHPYSEENPWIGTNMAIAIGPKKEVKLYIAIGDIKSVSADGIVCIQDVDFSNSSQTSKDILRLCGQDYKAELHELCNYNQVIGNVLPIKTGNGDITCKYVINVVLPNSTLSDFNESDPTLKEVTSNILRKSEELELTSLAMPYLESIEDSESGRHVSYTSSCEAMVSSILAFFNENDAIKKTFLRRLDILVKEEEILKELNLTFQRHCDQ